MNVPRRQSCSSPHPVGEGREAPDLEAFEAEVAGRLARLPRFEAGPELEARIGAALAAESAAPTRRIAPVAWAFAAAAALLLAIGAASFFGGGEAPAPSRPAASEAGGSWVMEDPSLTLYHDLETFEGLGVRPGDVLALGEDR